MAYFQGLCSFQGGYRYVPSQSFEHNMFPENKFQIWLHCTPHPLCSLSMPNFFHLSYFVLLFPSISSDDLFLIWIFLQQLIRKGIFLVILHLQAEAPKSSNPKIKFSAKNLESFEGLLNTIILKEALQKKQCSWGGGWVFVWTNDWLKSAGRFKAHGNLWESIRRDCNEEANSNVTHLQVILFFFGGFLVLIDSLSTDHHRGFLFVRCGIQQVIMTKQRSPPHPRFPTQGSLPSYLPHPPASWDPNAAKPAAGSVMLPPRLYLRSTPKRQTANILISPRHALMMTCLELRLKWRKGWQGLLLVKRCEKKHLSEVRFAHLFSKSQTFTC